MRSPMQKITGTFEVNLSPLDFNHDSANDIKLSRLNIDKTFNGDLSASSKGEMISAVTTVKGSAGYVALEQVTGQLLGKEGSFVLMHYGTMDQGKQKLILEVVPDSGTGELEGLKGQMQIIIKDGQHFYEFVFEL